MDRQRLNNGLCCKLRSHNKWWLFVGGKYQQDGTKQRTIWKLLFQLQWQTPHMSCWRCLRGHGEAFKCLVNGDDHTNVTECYRIDPPLCSHAVEPAEVLHVEPSPVPLSFSTGTPKTECSILDAAWPTECKHYYLILVLYSTFQFQNCLHCLLVHRIHIQYL